jgi:hypothetical protein
MSILNPAAVPRRNEELVVREVEEEVYVCADDGESMHILTDVAADIWRACDGVQSVADIADLLMAAYDIDRDTLERDMAEYLQDLESKKLIIFH